MRTLRWLFGSGTGRFFLVAWVAWAAWRFRAVYDGWLDAHWLFDDNEDAEWLSTGLLLPPLLMLVARWVLRGFLRDLGGGVPSKDDLLDWMRSSTDEELTNTIRVKLHAIHRGMDLQSATAWALTACYKAARATGRQREIGQEIVAAARLAVQEDALLGERFRDAIDEINAGRSPEHRS